MTSSNQYHANNNDQCQILIETPLVNKSKWSLYVGKVADISPVIDSTGTIYIGTANGDLIAVNPNGTLKWKRTITSATHADHQGIITGSPAMGNDGNIYVITTTDVTRKDRRNGSSQIILVRRSILHSYTSSGNLRWSFRFPSIQQGIGGYTSTSPKVWGDQNIFIFMPALYETNVNKTEILIVNQSGNLVNQTEVSNYVPPINEHRFDLANNSGSSWEFTQNSQDVTKNIFKLPEPTLAIADFGLDSNQPIVVIEDNYKTLSAFKWNFPILTPLWSHLSDKTRDQSSPAIFQNEEIFLTSKNGLISCYDLRKGTEKYLPWPKIEKPILNPPLLHINHFYIIMNNEILMIDYKLNITKSQPFSGHCRGNMASSANHIYISTDQGLQMFSLDLQLLAKIPEIIGESSTPAISVDGTVYVINNEGVLFAL